MCHLLQKQLGRELLEHGICFSTWWPPPPMSKVCGMAFYIMQRKKDD